MLASLRSRIAALVAAIGGRGRSTQSRPGAGPRHWRQARGGTRAPRWSAETPGPRRALERPSMSVVEAIRELGLPICEGNGLLDRHTPGVESEPWLPPAPSVGPSHAPERSAP